MTGSLWQRLWVGVHRLRLRDDWSRFSSPGWQDRIMDTAVTDCFHAKQGRSTGRWILRRNGRELAVYLKRHYELPWWLRMLATLWPGRSRSPAFHEWDHLVWARAQGLQVPDPVAAGEFIGPRGHLQSFLAIGELTGMLPLHEAIPLAAATLDAPTFQAWKRTLIGEMVRMVKLLHGKNRFHKDLYLCHFYIARTDCARLPAWRDKVFLIDLHRLGHHPWTSRTWQIKDLAQLLYSSEVEGVTQRDRLRFWCQYVGSQRRQWQGGLLGRCVLGKWLSYRRHNERAKAGKIAPITSTGQQARVA